MRRLDQTKIDINNAFNELKALIDKNRSDLKESIAATDSWVERLEEHLDEVANVPAAEPQSAEDKGQIQAAFHLTRCLERENDRVRSRVADLEEQQNDLRRDMTDYWRALRRLQEGKANV